MQQAEQTKKYRPVQTAGGRLRFSSLCDKIRQIRNSRLPVAGRIENRFYDREYRVYLQARHGRVFFIHRRTMDIFDDTGDYEISLPVFEGPMDLLLHLVEKNRVDIHDIPIHKIMDQYLAYMNQARKFDLALGSSFFLMAATLLLIKSRMLLPVRSQDSGDESEDPRRELSRSLEEFRAVKKIKLELEKLMEAERPYRKREPGEVKSGIFDRPISAERLMAFFGALWKKEGREQKEQVFEAEEVSLEDRLKLLRSWLGQCREGILLKQFFLSQHTRMELAVSLVAVLETVRTGEAVLYESMEGLSIRRDCL